LLHKVRNRLRGYFPFCNRWILWRKLNKSATTILDLGCGTGDPMVFINKDNRFLVTGIDGFSPSVEKCRESGYYDSVITADIMDTEWFVSNSFDVVMSLQVLEHLDKDDGEKLISEMLRIARKQVIITTDINEYVQGAVGGNELQIHRYIWDVDDLRTHGFHVYGLGIKGFGGDTGFGRWLPQPLRWFIGTSIQLLVGPFVYNNPKNAGAVVCVKNVK